MSVWPRYIGFHCQTIFNIFSLIHPGARYNCAGHFNDLTCECECDEQTFGDMEKVNIIKGEF